MPLPDELLGAWISDPTDLDGISEFGNVSLEFVSDGSRAGAPSSSGRTENESDCSSGGTT
jgi:hypothetical protein